MVKLGYADKRQGPRKLAVLTHVKYNSDRPLHPFSDIGIGPS
jgi:hypothetical protein